MTLCLCVSIYFINSLAYLMIRGCFVRISFGITEKKVKMTKNIIIICLIVISSISVMLLFSSNKSQKFKSDISLLEPWTQQNQDMYSPPFLAKYYKNGKRLYYIAAAHANSINSQTYRLKNL